MNRRALVLDELNLSPLWVRRELLSAAEEIAQEAALPAPIEQTVPGEEPDARHPLPPVARAANKALAPLISQEKAAAQNRSTATPIIIADNERSAAIAQMDWEALQIAVSQCTACSLCKTRTQAVFGVGNPQAALVVVGEAPGEEEDLKGEPFVGRAGKLLDNMLAAIHEKRGERVYIANVLKCRPPGNRNPLPEEIAQCTPFLLRQLELIAPKAILASGRFAAHTLLSTTAPLSALRGKIEQWRGTPVIVTYHPAYLLRNLPDKSKSWDDLLRLRHVLSATSPSTPDKTN